jgi:cardiolipin synthase
MPKTSSTPERYHWPRHHRILAAVLIGFLLVTAGLLLAQDQATLRIRSPLAIDDPRFPQYLANLLGHRLTSNNAYVVYTNGDHAFPAMLDTIDRATTQVDFENYIFEKGDAGTQFTNALERAAKRGAKVRLVLDSVGSKWMSGDDEDRLNAAGVKVRWVNPLFSFHLQEINYRTHRKTLIVDGNVAFVGGMGIADHWWHDTKGFPMWRDTQVEVRGPAVTDIEAAFNQNWIVVGGTVDPDVRPDSAPPSGAAPSIVVWSAPQTGANDLKLLYLLAIAAARHTIDIESPYLITDASSAWSLEQARQRGVRIRMLVESSKTDAKVVKYASRSQYDELLEQSVEIAEYQPTMMHAKSMMIDGEMSIIGSANFDNRSLELNDELNVAVFDRALARRLLDDFERDLTKSTRLDLEMWRSRPLPDKARDWLWSYFGEVF